MKFRHFCIGMCLPLWAVAIANAEARPRMDTSPVSNKPTHAAAHIPKAIPGSVGTHAPSSLRLQQAINEVFYQALPALKTVRSTDVGAYRRMLSSLTASQRATFAPRLGDPINKLTAFYGGSIWAFTAHVLNLPSSNDPVTDARSKAINDFICATDEVSTCASGSPSIEAAYDWMRKAVAQSGRQARLVKIGRSREGRPLFAIEIGRRNSAKRTLWFDGVIHGNEPIGFEVVKDITTHLLSRDPEAVRWRKTFNFVVVPIINPDGYALSHERVGWRKNARRLADGRIAGIDLNRAFPTKDPYKSPDSDPFAKEWMPDNAAQEPEIRAFMAYAALIRPYAALDFHSNAHFIATPNVDDNASKILFHDVAGQLQRVMRDEKGLANTYRAASANELFSKPDGTPGSVKSTNIQWLWENYATIAMSIELLDERSTRTWPDKKTREDALAGVKPAWKHFIETMIQRQ